MSFEMCFQAFPGPDSSLKYALVPWDSDLFGFPVYELRCGEVAGGIIRAVLGDLLRQLTLSPRGLVVSKIPPDSVDQARALTDHGFYPVETLLQVSLRLHNLIGLQARAPSQFELRKATLEDLPALQSIARWAFRADRFHRDPNLSDEAADRRYEHWIERGLRDQEQVFAYVSHPGGTVLGFVHARELGHGAIDLALGGVSVDNPHPGIGAWMFHEVFGILRAQGYQGVMSWVPVNNLPMLNLLLRAGFSVHRSVLTMHRNSGSPQ